MSYANLALTIASLGMLVGFLLLLDSATGGALTRAVLGALR